MSYQLQIVDTRSDFDALQKDWQELTQCAEASTLFSTWSWLSSWWDSYSLASDQLNIYIFSYEGNIIGAFPTYIHKEGICQTLYPIGYGEPEESEAASEYADVLVCGAEHQAAVVQLLAEHLKGWLRLYRCMYLQNVLEDSCLQKVVESLSSTYLHSKVLDGCRYIITLPEVMDAYCQSISSKNFRYQFRKALKSVTQEDQYSVELYEGPDVLKHGFSELKELHENRWKAVGLPGAFSTQVFCDFHKRLISAANDDSQLDVYLSSVKQGGRPIASHYGFIFKGTFYFYQSGVENQSGKLTAGVAAHALAIQYCIDHNMDNYDFMKGRLEGSYKEKYGAKKISMYSTHIYGSVFCRILIGLANKLKIKSKRSAGGE